MNTTTKLSTRKVLQNYFAAGFPCIALQTSEEGRAMAEILAAAKAINPPRSILTWSATEGMVPYGGKPIPDTEDLQAALAQKVRPETITILRDINVWPFDRVPPMLRGLRDYITAGATIGSCVVVLGTTFEPHPTIAKLVTVIDFDLPDATALREIAEGIAASAIESKIGDAARLVVTDDVVKAAGGMTTSEAENALSLSIIETGGLDAAVIYREKVKAVKRSGLLEIMPVDERGISSMGGGDRMKTWITKRAKALTQKAVDYRLPSTKGILIAGVPGTGKTLFAKLIAFVLARPLLKLDLSSMFNSLIGESERRLRDALALADAVSPCILLCDEIDKGLAGTSGSGSGDSGVSKRLLGIILTWMQERKSQVFIVATANDVTNLDPALFRAGRIDKVFAVDLPNVRDRAEILAIHIRARGRKPEQFDLRAVAEATEDFTGSEIEALLDEAMFDAFGDESVSDDDAAREFTTADLIAAVENIVPIAVTSKEQIDALRKWAQTRASFASSPIEEEPITVTATRTRRLAS